MGDAAWHPIATGMLVRQMPKQRGQALGVHAIGGTLAEVFSPLMVGFLLAVLDWQQVLQLSVLPAALMGTVFFFLVRRIPSRQISATLTRRDLLTFIHQWRSRTGLLLVAGIATYNMALIALMTMMPFYSQRTFGFSPAETGVAFALAMLAGSIGQPLVGRLSDRRGRFGIFASCSVLAATLSGICHVPGDAAHHCWDTGVRHGSTRRDPFWRPRDGCRLFKQARSDLDGFCLCSARWCRGTWGDLCRTNRRLQPGGKLRIRRGPLNLIDLALLQWHDAKA